MSEIYSIREAIDLLRPELAKRDLLLDKLKSFCQSEPKQDTYFATIPIDVCEIIASMISMRIIDLKPYFDNAKIMKRQFMEKYVVRPGQDTKLRVGDLDAGKIKEEYPDLNRPSWCGLFVKCVGSTIHVRTHDDNENWEYAGNMFMQHRHSGGILYPFDSEVFTEYIFEQFQIYRVLPCGLAFVIMKNSSKSVVKEYYLNADVKFNDHHMENRYYLVDFSAKKLQYATTWIQVSTPHLPWACYLNDLGEWIESDCSSVVWSELHGSFTRIFPW